VPSKTSKPRLVIIIVLYFTITGFSHLLCTCMFYTLWTQQQFWGTNFHLFFPFPSTCFPSPCPSP